MKNSTLFSLEKENASVIWENMPDYIFSLKILFCIMVAFMLVPGNTEFWKSRNNGLDCSNVWLPDVRPLCWSLLLLAMGAISWGTQRNPANLYLASASHEYSTRNHSVLHESLHYYRDLSIINYASIQPRVFTINGGPWWLSRARSLTLVLGNTWNSTARISTHKKPRLLMYKCVGRKKCANNQRESIN